MSGDEAGVLVDARIAGLEAVRGHSAAATQLVAVGWQQRTSLLYPSVLQHTWMFFEAKFLKPKKSIRNVLRT